MNTNERDLHHLKWLAIAHYVVAGLTGLLACIPIIHLKVGISLLTGEFFYDPPLIMGWFFVFMAVLAILLGWAIVVALFLAGRFLTRRQYRTFCLIVAAVSCLYTPINTVLGIFTILVLMRPSVIDLFTTVKDNLPPTNKNGQPAGPVEPQ